MEHYLSPYALELILYIGIVVCSFVILLFVKFIFQAKQSDQQQKRVAVFIASGALVQLFIIAFSIWYRTNGWALFGQSVFRTEQVVFLILKSLLIINALIWLSWCIWMLTKKNTKTPFGRVLIASYMTLFPIACLLIQRTELLAYTQISTHEIGEDWAGGENYYFVYLQNGSLIRQSLLDPSSAVVLKTLQTSKWDRIEFPNKTNDSNNISINLKSLVGSNVEFGISFVKAEVYGKFSSPNDNFQDAFGYVAELIPGIGAIKFSSNRSGIEFENSQGELQRLRYYSILDTLPFPSTQQRWASRIEFSYCTRIDAKRMVICFGDREIYLLNTENLTIAKLADGLSPIVYITKD